ncbi:MAG: dTMP kinase [Saprospiraceae bacterium]
MKRGKFIVFEGIDGSGKSLQAGLLQQQILSLHKNCLLTSEPSSRPIGKIIRQIFSGETEMDNLVVAGLFVADRLDHLLNKNDGIIDSLDQNHHVICDRYYLSSLAYQSVFVSMNWVMNANAKARELLTPDITFYLDLDPKLSMDRINTHRTSKEIYENLENLIKVRNNYLEAIKIVQQDEKIITIDAKLPIEEITKMIWEEVVQLL